MARINVGKGSIELSDANIVDLRGNDTYCPMVYDEQTIREAFRKCVGYADGVNKISDFPSVTPASSDKILIEQGGEGKSASLESLPIPKSVQKKLDTKVNYTDSLTYEEIMASTDLSGKVASASALKDSEIKIENTSMATQSLDNGFHTISLDLPSDMKELITCLPLAIKPTGSWNVDYYIYQYNTNSVSIRMSTDIPQVFMIYYTVIYK